MFTNFLIKLINSCLVLVICPILVLLIFSILMILAFLLLAVCGGIVLVWFPFLQIRLIWTENNGKSGEDQSS